MLDVIIKGGTVVAPEGAAVMDVGIQGEQIVAVAAPGTLDAGGARIIDAAGKIVWRVMGAVLVTLVMLWALDQEEDTFRY